MPHTNNPDPNNMSLKPSHSATLLALLLSLTGASVNAQQSEPHPNVAPSGRVTTSVTFDGRVTLQGGWFPGTPAHSGPSRIIIDYGQPHARGRSIFG